MFSYTFLNLFFVSLAISLLETCTEMTQCTYEVTSRQCYNLFWFVQSLLFLSGLLFWQENLKYLHKSHLMLMLFNFLYGFAMERLIGSEM